ncbi:MAG: class I lanthipeptide [Spirosomataceae bacterium]
MKKQVSKISLKTDKIVTLSKSDAQSVMGAQPVKTLSCQVGRCWPNG